MTVRPYVGVFYIVFFVIAVLFSPSMAHSEICCCGREKSSLRPTVGQELGPSKLSIDHICTMCGGFSSDDIRHLNKFCVYNNNLFWCNSGVMTGDESLELSESGFGERSHSQGGSEAIGNVLGSVPDGTAPSTPKISNDHLRRSGASNRPDDIYSFMFCDPVSASSKSLEGPNPQGDYHNQSQPRGNPQPSQPSQAAGDVRIPYIVPRGRCGYTSYGNGIYLINPNSEKEFSVTVRKTTVNPPGPYEQFGGVTTEIHQLNPGVEKMLGCTHPLGGPGTAESRWNIVGLL